MSKLALHQDASTFTSTLAIESFSDSQDYLLGLFIASSVSGSKNQCTRIAITHEQAEHLRDYLNMALVN